MTSTTADFWFDPACPWAWLASRWMLQVQRVRPVDVRWHVMSLGYLNSDKELALADMPKDISSWGPVRPGSAWRSDAETAGRSR